MLLQVGYFVFKVDLVPHFRQKLEKTGFFCIFLYISIVKTRKSQILLSGSTGIDSDLKISHEVSPAYMDSTLSI